MKNIHYICIISLCLIILIAILSHIYSVQKKALPQTDQIIQNNDNSLIDSNSVSTTVEKNDNNVTKTVTTPEVETTTSSSSPTTKAGSQNSNLTMHDSDTVKNELLSVEPFINTIYKYQVYYPQGWKVDSSPNSTKEVQYFINPTLDVVGGLKFATNINVTTSLNNGSAMTIENCISKEKLEIMFNNYELVSDTREIVDGNKARIVVGTWDYGEYKLQQTQQYIIKNGILYIVTGTTMKAVWDKHSELIEATRRSLDIL
jgi:hypothetical protein